MSDIETLRTAFGNIERLDPDGEIYRRLCATLDAASDDALKAVAAANIRFVSKLAVNRLIRRG